MNNIQRAGAVFQNLIHGSCEKMPVQNGTVCSLIRNVTSASGKRIGNLYNGTCQVTGLATRKIQVISQRALEIIRDPNVPTSLKVVVTACLAVITTMLIVPSLRHLMTDNLKALLTLVHLRQPGVVEARGNERSDNESSISRNKNDKKAESVTIQPSDQDSIQIAEEENGEEKEDGMQEDQIRRRWNQLDDNNVKTNSSEYGIEMKEEDGK